MSLIAPLLFGGLGRFTGDAGSSDFITTGNLLLGTPPRAAAGLIRVPFSAGARVVLAMRNAGDSADLPFLANTGVSTRVGDLGLDINWRGNTHLFSTSALSTFEVDIGGTFGFIQSSSAFQSGLPITGLTLAPSAYGVHGGVTFAFAADADYTVTAAQYQYDWLEFTTGAWTIGRTVTFPAPATKATGYYKTIFNNTTLTMTVSTGAGTTRTLATVLGRRFWFDNGGVSYAGPTFTP